MGHPKTCIIVLSFNGLAVTQKFIKDLYANTDNFDIIMIDNGSTDGTREFLSAFASERTNMRFVANDINLGIIDGRNQGYELYKTFPDKPEYFMFLDNDQFVQSGWLDHHHDVMKTGQFDIVGVEAWLLNRNCSPVQQCKKPFEPFSYVGCGGMLIKSTVAAQIGMFDSRFNPCYFEDPDFCYRARMAGFNIGWNYKAKLVHVAHQTLGHNAQRMQHFKKSHEYFRSKWGKIRMNPIRQHQVPTLQDVW